MQVHFWGTRGSLPAAPVPASIETKIVKAIKASRSYALNSDAAITDFVRNKLPFSVRATYGSNTSCVEIQAAEGYVLCDAGSGLRDFGHHLTASGKLHRDGLPNAYHIFISHLHWDHIQGFPFFIPAYIPGQRIHIYGMHPDLKGAFTHQQSPPFFPVPLSAMKGDISFHQLEPGQNYHIAGLRVAGIKQDHPGDSYGYRFEKNGKKIVYSTDAEHKEEADEANYAFLEFFRNVDLLIFDAQYTLLDAVHTKENWGHSSNLMGVELAVKAGVKRLCLFHSEHTYEDEAIDQFLADTRNYLRIHANDHPLEIHMAYDGLEIQV